MAYVDPTAAEIKARFPEFAAVSDALINQAITESASFVDDSWIEADFKPAKMHLVAHLLHLGGALSADSGGGTTPISTSDISSVHVGDVTVSLGARSSSGAAGGGGDLLSLAATTYGLIFLALRKRNFPSVAVIT